MCVVAGNFSNCSEKPEGMMFTDYYAEQRCTAGRASFITGQCGLREPG
jgi:hypothetical protein